MPLTTPQSLCTFALKAAGILGVGQSALAEDFSDVFDAMNAMLGQWNRKRWLIWHLLDLSIGSTGAQSYTIGPGGDINNQRPDRIEAAFFRQYVTSQPNAVDYPMVVLESREDYNQIALKTLTSWPQFMFYDPAFPLGNLYPWPIPQASNYELHISVKELLPQFSSYIQSINLPPEFIEALWSNLVLRLGAIYPGASITDDTRAIARGALATIRASNTQIPLLGLPRSLTTPDKYNIYSDTIYQ